MSEENNEVVENNNEDVIDNAADNNEDVIADAKAGDDASEEQTSGDVLDDVKAEEQSGDVLSVDDDAEVEGTPDSYTFDAPEEMPEGVVLDEGALERYSEAAKEVGLTQDQFQKLVEFSLQQTHESVIQANEAWEGRVNSWREAARTDPEFGGTNYDANVRVALKAVEQFGDAEFSKLIQSPSAENPEGLAIGNHPALLRFLARIGKAVGDPNFVSGNEARQEMTDKDRLARLYPSMVKK